MELNVTDPMGNVWNNSCCYFPYCLLLTSVKNKILLQNGKSDFYEEDGRHIRLKSTVKKFIS